MFGKIKVVLGKVKSFFVESKIDEKAKTVIDDGITAVKKSSEELLETVSKVSEAAAKNHEELKETLDRVKNAAKKPEKKAEEIKDIEKVIDDATHSHVTTDLAKDIGLSPICSTTDVTTEALKEAEKIKKDKVSKKNVKKCVIDEVAKEVAADKNYIRGTFKKNEIQVMQDALNCIGGYDVVVIAKDLNRDPVSVAKKMKQLAGVKTETTQA